MFGFVTLIVIFSFIGGYSVQSQQHPPLNASEKCARDPPKYNVTHAYDCAKFSPDSIAEHCVNHPNDYKLSNEAGCSKFISPT